MGFWSEDLLKMFLRKHKIFNKLRGFWRDKLIRNLLRGGLAKLNIIQRYTNCSDFYSGKNDLFVIMPNYVKAIFIFLMMY